MDVVRVADRPQDARRQRPVQLKRQLVALHVLERVDEVAGIEGDGGPVALDCGLDRFFGVVGVRLPAVEKMFGVLGALEGAYTIEPKV